MNQRAIQLMPPAVLSGKGPSNHDLLFEANPNPMWVYDDETLRFLAVNEAAVRHYGYSREEFLALTLKDIRPLEDVPDLLRVVQRERDAYVAHAGTFRHRKKSGALIQVEITISAALFEGRRAHLVLAHDVTAEKQNADALRQIGERLQFLISSTASVISACSPIAPYAPTFVSANVTAMLGHEPREFTEDPEFWASRVHPEDLDSLFQARPAVLVRGQCTHRYRFRHRDGSYRWMREDVRLVRDGQGQPQEILACWLDITEHRQAEEELKRQAELLDLTLEAIFVRDVAGRITFWNLGAEKLYGWKSHEALGQISYELLRTQFPEPLEQIDARLNTTGHWEGELLQTTREGQVLVVSSRWSLQLDKAAEPCGTLEVNSDISERKRAEKALRQAHDELELRVQERTFDLQAANQALLESQERFRQVAENIREVFWLSNTSLTEIIYVSPAYEEIWGRSCVELYEHPQAWFEAIHPEDKPRLEALFEKPLSPEGFEFEYRVVRPDGSIRWVQDHGFPVRDNKGVTYRLAGLARDITERRLLESEILNISDREQRRFGQDLHDDLGQQLVGIQFLSNALAQELKGLPQAVRAQEIAGFVQAATEHARLLARGLAPVQLQADGLMEALRDMTQRTSRIFNVRCSFTCPAPILVQDPTVGTHLYRIAQEAINNSLRHGHAAHIELELAAKGRKMRLRISDDGQGFAAAPAETRGMGLKTMQYRAQALGGTFAIEPGQQGGVSVICVVPRAGRRKRPNGRSKS